MRKNIYSKYDKQIVTYQDESELRKIFSNTTQNIFKGKVRTIIETWILFLPSYLNGIFFINTNKQA